MSQAQDGINSRNKQDGLVRLKIRSIVKFQAKLVCRISRTARELHGGGNSDDVAGQTDKQLSTSSRFQRMGEGRSEDFLLIGLQFWESRTSAELPVNN